MNLIALILASAVASPATSWGALQEQAALPLDPPLADGPVVVDARFELRDINEIDDEAETFAFSGVLTLTWRDPRQAFDPGLAGVREKVFQGEYQFNELSPAWYPQVTLVNDAGQYVVSGIVLRVRPDGTASLTQMVSAVAEMEVSMRRFPLDRHRLEAVFEVPGFFGDEVVFRAGAEAASVAGGQVRVPQWTVHGVSASSEERGAPHAGGNRLSSVFVVGLDVERQPFFIVRLVVFPLLVIALLSFSVFWMDRSSVGDRLAVSFIGILTGVAYNLVIGDNLPSIAYFTLIHGFLNLSFLAMCATVVVNLVVNAQDKRGHDEVGDRIDRRCRWAFPVFYLGLNLAMLIAAFTLFE